MKLFIIVLMIATLGLSLHLERKHQRQISKECCALKGGVECGKVQKDCCIIPEGLSQEQKKGNICVSGGLFSSSQYCPGEKITEECQYCHKFCDQKKGIMCGLTSTDAHQCCPSESCITDINFHFNMKKCKPGTEIQLPECVNDMDISDQVFGQIQNVV